MTNRLNRIRTKLIDLFPAETFSIEDDSARHAGHAGARPDGETHYTIKLDSSNLKGQSRIEIHRKINEALSKEFETGLHALSIRIIKSDAS